MHDLSNEEVLKIKETYKPGTQIKCVHMGDDFPCNSPVPDGMIGFVTGVDDKGTIHMHWNNGSSLGLIPKLDAFEVYSG